MKGNVPMDDKPLLDLKSFKDAVPNLCNIYKGKIYTGYGIAEMIKDVGWKPKPAGKGSRETQLKRLHQFFDWETEKLTNNKSTTKITEVFDEIKEYTTPMGRPKIYEPLIEELLLSVLYKSNKKKIEVTKINFFRLLNILPKYYHKIPTEYYEDTLPEEYIKYANIEKIHKQFYMMVDSKLSKIFCQTLDFLESKRKITYEKHTIIITQTNDRIDINKLDYEEANEKLKQITEAREYAINNTFYIENGRKFFCKTWETIIDKKKIFNFYNLYKEYIKDNYGWGYTYEEISIVALSNNILKKSIDVTIEALQEKLIKYFRQNCKTKVENKKIKLEKELQPIFDDCKNNRISLRLYDNEISAIYQDLKIPSKYFQEIINIMIDTEVVISKEIEEKCMNWMNENPPPNLMYI